MIIKLSLGVKGTMSILLSLLFIIKFNFEL